MKTKGVVIYAHNNREIDFSLISMVSASLVKKNLLMPVSLITDKHTVKWMKKSDIYDRSLEIFDQIIEVEKPITNNSRRLSDGNESKIIPFNNLNRNTVWDATPYDRTLLIDSDFLIYTNVLNQYWEVESDLLIAPHMKDIRGDRIGTLDSWISDTGIPLHWATTVMFTKNDYSKLFFKLVGHIRDNYNLYSQIYRFNPFMYRNDVSFSIAKHLLDGFTTDRTNFLPPIFTVQDKDTIFSVDNLGIKVLIYDTLSEKGSMISNLNGIDVHIMNKQSIVRFSEELMVL